MSKTRKKEIVLTCLGSSIQQVTGSCWSIEFPRYNGETGLIVIECGLNQDGFTTLEQYNANERMLNGIGKEVVENCEYLLIGHSHVDHVGNLSYFNDDNGFKGRIISSEKCIEISKPLIKNSINIHEANIKELREKGKKKRPLYTKPQMYQMFDHMEYIEQSKEIELDDQVSVIFHKNNHVVGANSISIFIKDLNKRKHHIYYTSDLGCQCTQELHPFVDKLEYPTKCDVMITEATYSDSQRGFTHKKAIKEREELKSLMVEGLKKSEDSQLLIPTFSFSRTQEFLVWLYDNFKNDKFFDNIPIILDGVLVDEINKVYSRILESEDKKKFEDVMRWHNIKVNTSLEGTRAILSKRCRRIIISSSGFLSGGRVTNYLPSIVESSKDRIILLGYAGSEDSLAGVLIDTEQGKPVNMFNRTILKNCDIYQMKTWSSHMQFDELLKLFNEVNTPRILVHHCDNENKEEFCNKANEYLRDRNKTTRVIGVNKGCFEFKL